MHEWVMSGDTPGCCLMLCFTRTKPEPERESHPLVAAARAREKLLCANLSVCLRQGTHHGTPAPVSAYVSMHPYMHAPIHPPEGLWCKLVPGLVPAMREFV